MKTLYAGYPTYFKRLKENRPMHVWNLKKIGIFDIFSNGNAGQKYNITRAGFSEKRVVRRVAICNLSERDEFKLFVVGEQHSKNLFRHLSGNRRTIKSNLCEFNTGPTVGVSNIVKKKNLIFSALFANGIPRSRNTPFLFAPESNKLGQDLTNKLLGLGCSMLPSNS